MKPLLFASLLLVSSVAFGVDKTAVQSAEQKSPQQKNAVQHSDAAQKSDTLARRGWFGRRSARVCRSGACG